MQNEPETSLDSDEQTIIRDFDGDESASAVSRCEAKFIDDVEKRYIENEIVLVRETRSLEGEQLYHIPREVFEGIVDQLP